MGFCFCRRLFAGAVAAHRNAIGVSALDPVRFLSSTLAKPNRQKPQLDVGPLVPKVPAASRRTTTRAYLFGPHPGARGFFEARVETREQRAGHTHLMSSDDHNEKLSCRYGTPVSCDRAADKSDLYGSHRDCCSPSPSFSAHRARSCRGSSKQTRRIAEQV